MFIFLISEQISAHKPPLLCLSTNHVLFPRLISLPKQIKQGKQDSENFILVEGQIKITY